MGTAKNPDPIRPMVNSAAAALPANGRILRALDVCLAGLEQGGGRREDDEIHHNIRKKHSNVYVERIMTQL